MYYQKQAKADAFEQAEGKTGDYKQRKGRVKGAVLAGPDHVQMLDI